MDRHPNRSDFGRFLVVVGALLVAAPASAQGGSEPEAEALEEARRIFTEGLGHSDRQEWHEAVASFRQVMEIRAAPPVLYNLAVALVEIGEYPEAHDLLAQVLADAETSDEIRAQARSLERELAQRAGTVVITYGGDPSGLIFSIDNYPLPPAEAAEPHYVAPGAHEVSVRRGSAVLARADVVVERGATTRVALAPPDATPEAEVAEAEVVEVAEPPPVEARTERRRVRESPWLWVGVGAAAAVVLTVVLATTIDGPTGEPHTGNFTPGRITF